MAKFSGQLGEYFRQAGLPLRRVARGAGIPHQTLFNWLRGVQPRWHPSLPGDLCRLGATLGLAGSEIAALLRLAGCAPARAELSDQEEAGMKTNNRVPKGWSISTIFPTCYEIGLDPDVTYENRACVTIKAGPEPSEFGSLLQTIKADGYRGKRVRYSAALRTAGVENRAGLFMRVDGSGDRMLAFDNMSESPLCGTTGWAHYSVVLNVAAEAETLTFGLLLEVSGQVWMADARLEEVGQDVQVTDLLGERMPKSPVNLAFEE